MMNQSIDTEWWLVKRESPSLRGYSKKGASFFLLVCLLFLLSGCGPERAEDAALYAGDTAGQTLQLLFFPEAYWKEKRAVLQRDMQEKQAVFKERAQAYHVLLKQRRESMLQAMSQAKADGSDPRAMRRAVIRAFRDTIDPVRQEARQCGKALRRAMALLSRAEVAASK